MSYNNVDNVSIRTVLTREGKRLLAQGQFLPSSFALSDTMVDYGLYIISDPPTSTDGILIQSMPLQLQTQYSPFYPLFNHQRGVQTTWKINLKGNTSTTFQLNSTKIYQIIPQTPGMVQEYTIFIPNTRYFINKVSGAASQKYAGTLTGTQFALTSIANIVNITNIYGEITTITITGKSSGAQLSIQFVFNAAGQYLMGV